LSSADVVIQNLGPGAVDRLGFGSAHLREAYPRLIACGISGYGSTGPYREKKAYDLLLQCEAGFLAVSGTPETPSKAGISVADIAAGMYAYSGILMALYQRERTGHGSSFEVSMLEALGEWMSYPGYFTAYGGTAPPRTGASHATIAPYGPFRTGDQRVVFLGVQNEREWLRFCTAVLGQPKLGDDPRFSSNSARVDNREALQELIEGVFLSLSAEQVVGRLDGAQIANARLNSVEEFWEHPQLRSRDRWRTVESPAGLLQAMLPPVQLDGGEAVMGPIPAVGEHTDRILRELGYSAEEISGFRQAGVV
jgi:itaconate CoA-transferase